MATLKSFKEHLNESFELIMEKLITFGGKAYPRAGNVVIMAGGAGSGKGFVKDRLIGLEGYTFDVDEIKKLAIKSKGFTDRSKSELGIDLKKLDLKIPEDVAKLHQVVGDYFEIDNKRMKSLYTSILGANPENKPNIIFDVTLKDLTKLQNLTNAVKSIGYKSENIHIVWVVNDIEIAKKQNMMRDRRVPVEILINTHRGVSQTMNDIVNMGKTITRYMDGDIVFAFNKVGVDSSMQQRQGISKGKYAGMAGFITTANYFYIKRAGQPIIPLTSIEADVKRKIAEYVPKGVTWE
jgi:predicted kinase